MDNTTRSERTRAAAIQAALAIIARDGAGRLTLDAIARESGMSKGALMHQFHTKEAVLKALLEHQVAHFEAFSRRYLAEHAGALPQPQLAVQIATLREAVASSQPVALAILGAMAQEPDLLTITRKDDAARLKAIKAEAPDPDLALLRWAAAQGLALSSLFGLSPLPPEDRERLFDQLLDDSRWPPRPGGEAPKKQKKAR